MWAKIENGIAKFPPKNDPERGLYNVDRSTKWLIEHGYVECDPRELEQETIAPLVQLRKIRKDLMQYLEALRDQIGLTMSVAEFASVARAMTSAELKAWAIERGVPMDAVQIAAANLLAFLADANRYGYSWDDLFQFDDQP